MIFSQPPLQVKHTTADSPEELLDGGCQSRQVAEHFEAQGFVVVIRQGFPLGGGKILLQHGFYLRAGGGGMDNGGDFKVQGQGTVVQIGGSHGGYVVVHQDHLLVQEYNPEWSQTEASCLSFHPKSQVQPHHS